MTIDTNNYDDHAADINEVDDVPPHECRNDVERCLHNLPVWLPSLLAARRAYHFVIRRSSFCHQDDAEERLKRKCNSFEPRAGPI